MAIKTLKGTTTNKQTGTMLQLSSPPRYRTVFLPLTILLISFVGFASPELNLPIRATDEWARIFGEDMSAVATKATALTDLQGDYLSIEMSVKKIDGNAMIRDMKLKMEEMLSKKVKAIRKLVSVAEEAHKEHVYDENIKVNVNMSYPKAKKLNTSEFPLEENEHFNYIQVNLNESTVHVPTNVYDESAAVVNGVLWSAALDEIFRDNYEEDPTLTWQYFGAAEGYFRNYPGTEWRTYEKGDIDLYDCRLRGWYIQAATSPKDVVILLDASGSMTGLRMEIAKATVIKILDTLSDDDFFNVIKFSTFPEYVDDCFNGTLVQANADNKKRVKEALDNIKTTDIAFFDKALVEAFELLRAVNYTGKGAQCNRAIMIVTDGAPENHVEIFNEYNWPEKNETESETGFPMLAPVRVFSFLIGREVTHNKEIHWMACANKGYYSHISTLADVHEHVQDYIHVLSRPMVIQRINHTAWTSVYVDAAGLKLMTSVAQPVFDTSNETKNDGILLGVMGTDVPLKELTKLTPQYKLGVNGYAFAITNNGYILFHPDFRPTDGDFVKPNYNSVDLAEVELSDTDKFPEPGLVQPNYNIELRKKMVDRETGQLKMRVKMHYDSMRRVTIRTNNYFFTDVADTPFSLGIALPEGYGMHYLDGQKKLRDADLNAIKVGTLKIAPWNFCKMDTNETKQDPVEMLLKYMEYGRDPATRYIYNDKCDEDLIESFLFDAEATRYVNVNWFKENWDGLPNEFESRNNCTNSSLCPPSATLPSNGVEMVFLGTKGGLTRYHQIVENLTDPMFIEQNTSTIEELYYKRAVENGEGIWTFSVPKFMDGSDNWNASVIMATTPIIVTEDNKVAVAAVAGMQMRYDKFYEYFVNISRVCPAYDPNCNLTCESPELDCYLIDENGWVILAESVDLIGKFFGEIDGTLMKELTLNDELSPTGSPKGVFNKTVIYDYQGICGIWQSGGSSANSMFVDPIRHFFSSVTSMLHEVVLFFIQFNIMTWWHGDYSVAQGVEQGPPFTVDNVDEEDPAIILEDFAGNPDDYTTNMSGNPNYGGADDGRDDVNYYVPDFDTLSKFASEEDINQWGNEWRRLIGANSPAYVIKEWYENIRKMVEPHIIGHRSCIQHHSLFKAQRDNLPSMGTLVGCDTLGLCSKSYSIHRVHKTNLMLLAVDALCDCIKDPPISVDAVEIEYNDTMMCERLQQEIYRSRPKECYAYHPDEDPKNCGRCALLKPSAGLLLASILLTLYITLQQLTSHHHQQQRHHHHQR